MARMALRVKRHAGATWPAGTTVVPNELPLRLAAPGRIRGLPARRPSARVPRPAAGAVRAGGLPRATAGRPRAPRPRHAATRHCAPTKTTKIHATAALHDSDEHHDA